MPTALIIGASRGIGLALASEYRAAGWKVFASARSGHDVAQLTEAGMEAFACDVNNVSDVAGLGWRFDDEKLDVVILNAGVMSTSNAPLATPDVHEFDHVMHTNVLAAMRILPIIAPMLREPSGRLAVVSSRMGSLSLRDGPGSWLYRASKAALNSVLLDVSKCFPKIVSVALHPGWVQTDMGGKSATLTPQQSAAGIRKTLAGLTAADNGSYYNYDGKKLTW